MELKLEKKKNEKREQRKVYEKDYKSESCEENNVTMQETNNEKE